MLVRVLLLSALVFLGCREDLARRDTSDSPFSMYGVMSPQLEIQSIRVYSVESFPTLGSTEPLDADVFSTDLQTGEHVAWRDSVIEESSGQYAHVFWAEFRAEYGHEYRIEAVRRSDGEASVVDVRVPEAVNVTVVDESNPGATVIRIDGKEIRPLKSEVIYRIANVNPECRVLVDRFSYEGDEYASGDGWQLDINLSSDRFDILFDCGGITIAPLPYCPPYVGLDGIDLHFIVGDTDWNPPNGIFDGHILSEPNVMSNVQNGFGFVGAGYRHAARIELSRQALERACFTSDNDESA